MPAIAPTTSLGDIVLTRPAAVRLLERLRLDYCCGGQRTLEDACAQRGLDAHTVITLLDSLEADSGYGIDPHDIARASIGEICDHVIEAHHQKTRNELPRIDELLTTVVRVHGRQRANLTDLQRIFAGLRSELEAHFVLEEAELFPACRAVESGQAPENLDEALLAMCEGTHELTGEALSALRELCDGYDTTNALCATHRALLDALHGLELDLHQHVHEENNVLFPRVRGLATAG